MRKGGRANIEALRRAIKGKGEVFAPHDAEEPILSGPVRSAIFGWMAELNALDELAAVGLKPRSSALLSGPPGCGKTTLVHHLAARLGIPMVLVAAEHLLDCYLGGSEKNIAALFDGLRDCDGPCVLLLDEIDAIGAKRTSAGNDKGGAASARNSTLTVILRHVEAFEGVLVGATNRAGDLDPALWRRFGMQIEVGLPDDDARFAIMKRYGAPFEFSDAAIDALTDLTEGASPALLRQLMEGVKRNIILGARLRKQAMTIEDAFAAVVAQTGPHPDYTPPPLWSDLQCSLGELRDLSAGHPWPPMRPAKEDSEGKAA